MGEYMGIYRGDPPPLSEEQQAAKDKLVIGFRVGSNMPCVVCLECRKDVTVQDHETDCHTGKVLATIGSKGRVQ